MLKAVSATFLPVCFGCLKDCTCEARENVFYFASKALHILEISACDKDAYFENSQTILIVK